jgi:hypothetical protein
MMMMRRRRRRNCELERGEVTGEYRKLHNRKVSDLYS